MGRINKANIKKTIYYLKRNGIRNTWYAAKERMEEAKKAPYQYTPPTRQELAWQKKTPTIFQGVISIVVPAYHTVPKYLRELIASLLQQTYPNWELILADASRDDSVETVVKTYSDKRIRYVRLRENAGIAQNTNNAIEYATGEYIGLLDHDDVLTDDALYEMAVAITKRKQAGIDVKMLYSDEDKCNSDRTEYYEPNLKEKFNLDLLLSNNYICHFLVMESTLMRELRFRPEYDGAQDYDLVLRAAERFMEQEEQLVHIPKVLYHWRCHSASTAENPQSKQYAYDAGLRALQDFADRMGWRARAVSLRHLGFYTLQYEGGVLQNRKDIGAVGGRLIGESANMSRNSMQLSYGSRKNRTIGGRMSKTGELYYEGLPMQYSGYLHRAALTQDAEVIDIRCIQVKAKLQDLFQEVTGVPYQTIPNTDLFDASILPKGTDYVALSIQLSNAIRERGYRLLYLPTQTTKWKDAH